MLVLIMSSHPLIVGILNVTPDSYVDGGKYLSVDAAVKRAEECLAEGASILDIGGESTGPGSVDVSLQEELSRVLPIVQAIKKKFPTLRIAVDTYKADVAREVLSAGASMINDVTAGRGDPAMFAVIAKAKCDYVMMYSKDATARTTKDEKKYDDVIATVHSFLHERRRLAMEAGIAADKIIVDPGLGHFVSADPLYSYEILSNLERFSDLGRIYVSPSRKSFVASIGNVPVKDRLPATLAATGLALMRGASFVRTHDVKETKNFMESMSGLVSFCREKV